MFMQHPSTCTIVIGITSDHGMNPKMGYDGSARAVWVEDILLEAGIEGVVVLGGSENEVQAHAFVLFWSTLEFAHKYTSMKYTISGVIAL